VIDNPPRVVQRKPDQVLRAVEVAAMNLKARLVDDDLTALLMDRFYHHLISGSSVAAALDAAKFDLRNEPATRHPFAWAGFVAIGYGESIMPMAAGGDLRWWYGPLLGVVLVATVLAVVVRRRRSA